MAALEIDAAQLDGVEAARSGGGERAIEGRGIHRPGVEREAAEFVGLCHDVENCAEPTAAPASSPIEVRPGPRNHAGWQPVQGSGLMTAEARLWQAVTGEHAMRLLKIMLVLLVCAAQPAMAGPLEDAVVAYDKRDYRTALDLISPLAEQGNADAQFMLGRMYDSGHGVPKDYAAAVAWWRRAANQGNTQAQVNLGYMYRLGQGVPQDDVQAHVWLSLAASRRSAVAEEDRKRIIETIGFIELKLTDDQRAMAQKLAREWKPRPERQ